MSEREVVRYRCADGTVVVQSEDYPTLFYVDGLPAVSCTLAFWREHRGGPLERVQEVSP